MHDDETNITAANGAPEQDARHKHGHPHHIEIEHIEHNETLLILRNTFVIIAALMFLLTFAPSTVLDAKQAYSAGGIAYLLGAVAYLMELLMLNDLFRKKTPFGEMLMPYVFGGLYVMMGIRYLLR